MKKIDNDSLLYKILQYILVFTIILECNSIYSQIYGCHLIIRLVMTVIAIISIIFLIIPKKIKIHKPILFFIIYDILCVIMMLINTDSLSGNGIITLVFLIFLPLLLIYLSNITKEEFKNLLTKFVNVVVVLSVISLIFYILILLLKLKPTTTIKIVWGKPYTLIESYYHLYFNTQDVWWLTGKSLMRNTGIFCEGPMYALILVVALIFNNLLNFKNTKSNLLKTIILFITMLTTISVTGIICSIIIIATNIKKYVLDMKKSYRKWFVISLLIVIICMIPIGLNFLSKKMNTSSAIHRNMDIEIGLNTFLEKPLIGHGINHERATEIDYENGYGYSNTIIPVITDGGILLGAIYIIPIVLLIIDGVKKRKINYLTFSLVFIILLFTTLIQYRLIMMLLISIIYCIIYNDYLVEENV